MKALIFGCGPAGLIAAHAAACRGWDVLIYSKPRRSYMKGAQYLHAPIPGATSKVSFEINYVLSGPLDGYRDKVYGSASRVEVSPASLIGRHPAWDIRQTYDWLWGTYGSYVQDFDAYPESVAALVSVLKPDMTVSTVPAKLLCRGGHGFSSAYIWSTDRKMAMIPDNSVLCQGEKSFGWYRTSRILGYENTEWPHDTKPPIPQHRLWEVEKPIDTNCDCFPEIHRMGRYGRWRKGVLSHHAWEETNAIMNVQEMKKV